MVGEGIVPSAALASTTRRFRAGFIESASSDRAGREEGAFACSGLDGTSAISAMIDLCFFARLFLATFSSATTARFLAPVRINAGSSSGSVPGMLKSTVSMPVVSGNLSWVLLALGDRTRIGDLSASEPGVCARVRDVRMYGGVGGGWKDGVLRSNWNSPPLLLLLLPSPRHDGRSCTLFFFVLEKNFLYLLLRPVVAPACRESKLRLDDFGGERFRVKHTPPIEVGPVAPNMPPPPPDRYFIPRMTVVLLKRQQCQCCTRQYNTVGRERETRLHQLVCYHRNLPTLATLHPPRCTHHATRHTPRTRHAHPHFRCMVSLAPALLAIL